MSNKLIVFYSRTGTTKRIAEQLSNMLQCDIEEVVDKKKRSGPIGWIKSGRDGASKNLTDIEETKHDPENYDTIILGTPVWAGHMSSPMRTYIKNNKERMKNIAIFSTGSTTNKKFLDELKEFSEKSPVASIALRATEIMKNEHINKLKEFVSEIK